MTTAYHMVHYRRFETGAKLPAKAKLESLCRAALGEKDGAGTTLWQRIPDRVFDLADNEGRQIVLNRVVDLSSAVFGEMCLVQSQGLQALLELQKSKVTLSNITVAEIYGLHETKAPKGSQFIRGMTYWLAVDDHLFFVKTQSMTPQLIHGYFDWLLKSGGTFPGGGSFDFKAEFDQSEVGSDIGEIKSLRVSGRATPQIQVVPTKSKTKPATSRTIADKFLQFEQALPVVEALFGKRNAASLVESLGPAEYLAVDATVKVRGRRTEESREKVLELANELADLTDGKVQVEGKDGKVSDGDAILRTRMPFDLSLEGSNLLEFDNVADQLQEVYARFVKDGKIKA